MVVQVPPSSRYSRPANVKSTSTSSTSVPSSNYSGTNSSAERMNAFMKVSMPSGAAPAEKITFPNLPCRRLVKGEYFSPQVLFALSTRPHHSGKNRKLATMQRPSDMELICVEYRFKKDFSGDFELKPDQNVVTNIKPDGFAGVHGVCEGYELVFVEGVRVSHLDAEDIIENLNTFPAMLGFVSPLAEPPNLSNRQCGIRLGINKIKERMLRDFTDSVDALWAGNPNFRFTFVVFKKLIRQAGILWLNTRDLRELYECMDLNKDEDIDRGEWKIALADTFMFSDKFAHLSRAITRMHIKDISFFIESFLRKKKADWLSFPEMASCMFKGGLTWLTRQQLFFIFSNLDENGDGIVTFSEWTARFQFDLVEAAQEVSRHFKSLQSKGINIPSQMDCALWVLTLHSCGLNWLTDEQAETLFHMIDRDQTGVVVHEELFHTGDLVEQFCEIRQSMRQKLRMSSMPSGVCSAPVHKTETIMPSFGSVVDRDLAEVDRNRPDTTPRESDRETAQLGADVSEEPAAAFEKQEDDTVDKSMASIAKEPLKDVDASADTMQIPQDATLNETLAADDSQLAGGGLIQPMFDANGLLLNAEQLTSDQRRSLLEEQREKLEQKLLDEEEERSPSLMHSRVRSELASDVSQDIIRDAVGEDEEQVKDLSTSKASSKDVIENIAQDIVRSAIDTGSRLASPQISPKISPIPTHATPLQTVDGSILPTEDGGPSFGGFSGPEVHVSEQGFIQNDEGSSEGPEIVDNLSSKGGKTYQPTGFILGDEQHPSHDMAEHVNIASSVASFGGAVEDVSNEITNSALEIGIDSVRENGNPASREATPRTPDGTTPMEPTPREVRQIEDRTPRTRHSLSHEAANDAISNILLNSYREEEPPEDTSNRDQ